MEQNRIDELNFAFMKTALIFSDFSYAERKKVGAVIVKDGNIIAMGWNGTPKGFNNICEDENGVTLPSVIHGELNAVLKAAKSGASLQGSSLYVTMSTCANCALLVIQSGIKEVYYLEEYRDITGLDILRKAGIIVQQLFLK